MAKILVSTYGTFVPLAKLLAQHGHTFIALQPQMAKYLSDSDVKVQPVIEALGPKERDSAVATAAEILAAALKLPLPKYLAPGVRKWIAGYQSAFLYPRLGELAQAVAAVNASKPDLAIIHNDTEPLTQAVAQWCKAHHVPCLHVPHAIYLEAEDRLGDDLHFHLEASHGVAAGPFQAEWFIHFGTPKDNVRITGLPQFDRMLNQIGHERACQLIGLNAHKPVITYAGTWRQDTNLGGCHDGDRETYEAFIAAAKNIQNVAPIKPQFVIKLHPNAANGQWHADTAQKAGLDCFITAQHVEIVLQASDLVLSCGPSNLILEAAHVPGVRLAVTSGYPHDPEVAKVGSEVADLVEGLGALLGNPPADTHRLLAKYCGPHDGHSLERIAMFAEELARG